MHHFLLMCFSHFFQPLPVKWIEVQRQNSQLNRFRYFRGKITT